MKALRFIFYYFIHLLKAKNTRGHGVHSPFLYRFTQNVVYEKLPFYIFSKIEKLRIYNQHDQRILQLTDFGTGKRNSAKIAEIAKRSLKKPNWAQLLYRIVNITQAKTVLELGTSLGLTTAYLASPDKYLRCITFEGSAEVANVARENFGKLGLNNIEIVVGNIDETLKPVLNNLDTIDVVFFDANHRKEPVLRYFDQCVEHVQQYSVFVFDDIHWSAEMEEAWSEIKKHEKVYSTIDLFEFGIVFFDKYLPRKHYRMKI